MISPCVKNHPEEKLAVPFRAQGTTHTTTQSHQNLQKSSTKLKYHLPNQIPPKQLHSSRLKKGCRLVFQHLIPIKKIFYIWGASAHRGANSLITGNSSILFFPSLPPCYRVGILLTTFSSSPLSEPFQGQIIPSTCTLSARQSNLTAPTHRSQCTFSTDCVLFSSCSPLLHLCQSSEKAVAPCVTFLHQEERARMIPQLKPWLQALAHKLLQDLHHPWKATMLMH